MNLTEYKRQVVLNDFGFPLDEQYQLVKNYVDSIFIDIHPYISNHDFYSIYYIKSNNDILFEYNQSEDYINIYKHNINMEYFNNLGFKSTEIDYILITKAIEYLKL